MPGTLVKSTKASMKISLPLLTIGMVCLLMPLISTSADTQSTTSYLQVEQQPTYEGTYREEESLSSGSTLLDKERILSPLADTLPREGARKYFWVNAGLGGTSMRNNAGSATISLNYQYNKRLFTGRYVYNAPYLIFSTLYHSVREVSVLYGISAKGRVGYASIGAGIGLVRNVLYHDGWLSTKGHKQNLYTGPGIPLESQLFLTTRYVGIGLLLLANINPHDSYVGYLLSLQAGKLKNKRVRL